MEEHLTIGRSLIHDNLTLIVCDKNWNEVLRDGTDRERFPESFPSLDEACNEAYIQFSCAC